MYHPIVSAVVVSYNCSSYIHRCIDSLLAQSYEHIEIIIADNASTSGSAVVLEERYRNCERVQLLLQREHVYFAEANNRGLALAQGEYVLLVTPDTVTAPDAVEQLVNYCREREDVWLCQPLLLRLDPPHRVDAAGKLINPLGFPVELGKGAPREFYEGKSAQPIFAAKGAAMFARTQRLREIGSLDSVFLMNYEDIDLAWRVLLSRGDVHLVPTALIYHGGSPTLARVPYLAFYCSYKNVIRMLLMNYSVSDALKYVPVATLEIGAMLFHVLRGDFRMAMTLARTLAWNCRLIPNTLHQRRAVERRRRRTDYEISCRINDTISIITPMYRPFVHRLEGILRRIYF